MIPSAHLDGKVLFKSNYEINFVPNGNGDIFRALKYHKIMDELYYLFFLKKG